MVLFSPEDLFLVKGAPALRRRYLDAELSQASPAYYGELLRYTHILRQRGAVLKDIRERLAPVDALLPWDAQLARSAAWIVTRRIAAVADLGALSTRVQAVLADGEELTLSYEIAGADEDVPGAKEGMAKRLELWYNEMLIENRARDIVRAATGTGPHLDDLVLRVDGMSLRSYGSQGQQRTGALALKIAELFYLREKTSEAPILLLDDVMASWMPIGVGRFSISSGASASRHLSPRRMRRIFLLSAWGRTAMCRRDRFWRIRRESDAHDAWYGGCRR